MAVICGFLSAWVWTGVWPGPVGLHFLEQGVEALEARLTELAVVLQPAGGVGSGWRLEPAGAALGVAAARDQAGVLQHLEVLGDRGLAHLERLGELLDRGLAQREPREDRPSRRVGKSGEGGVELMSRRHK